MNKTDSTVKEILERLQAPLETPEGNITELPPPKKKQRQCSVGSSEASEDSTPSSPRIDPKAHFSSPDAIKKINDADGALTVDDHGQVRYLGNSSGFYLLAGSRTYKNGLFHANGLYRRLNKDHQQESKNYTTKKYKVDPFELPDKEIASELFNIYFEYFYPVLPLFFKKNIICLSQTEEPVSLLLLNAIYAIASRMSSNIHVRSDPSSPYTAGDVFFERATCLLEDVYDTPKISTIQALLLLTSHQMGCMKPAKAWIYGGMAFRMAQDLGLNRNCDHWDISLEEKERRKRVFWCCYIMDRFMSASYGRSANFDERDCDASLPSVDDDEPLPKKHASEPPIRLLEVFLEYIKMANNLGHVLENIYYAKSKEQTGIQRINRTFQVLRKQLNEWYAKLPDPLQYQLPNTQNGETAPAPHFTVCQLHLMYYTALILLHRPFIPGHRQAQLSTSTPFFKICESAATSILNIVNTMLSEDNLRYTHNSSVYYIFTAGTIFVQLATSCQDPIRAFDAKIHTNRIITALDNVEVTWMNASRCCNILGELAGLRDIKLEADKYVPEEVNKPKPQPSIAIPNSPKHGGTITNKTFPAVSSVRETLQPEVVIDSSTMHSDVIDPLDMVFWGIPSSLNVNDWDTYFENMQQQ